MVISKQSITKTPWKLLTQLYGYYTIYLTFRYTATKLSLLFMLKACRLTCIPHDFAWNDFQIFKCKQTGKKVTSATLYNGVIYCLTTENIWYF